MLRFSGLPGIELISRALHLRGAISSPVEALTLTRYWSLFRSVQSWCARIIAYGSKYAFAIRHDVELQRRVLNAIRVIAIDPSAFRDVLAATISRLQLSGRFDTVIPRLAALIANVTGPGSARGVIKLLNRDPGDASRIVVVGDADVAGYFSGGALVDGLLADAT